MGCPFSQPYELWLLQKNLYVLQLTTNHWFNKLTITLIDMVLIVYPHNPFIYTETFTIEGPPIYIGLYMDDFFTLANKMRCSNSSGQIYPQCSRLTGKAIQTGSWEHYLSGPKI